MKINEPMPEFTAINPKSFNCPFCNHSFPLIPSTYTCYESSFSHADTLNKVSITVEGINNDLKNIFIPIYPNSLAKQFPEYIPQAIRNDYEEAYSIVSLSPKASATLSRRCLQGMIRDFWNIKKSNLAEAINELQSKVTPSQWKAINSVRSIGNIGAHMEKDINVIIDVDPDEAEKLLKLIELLIDKWYITKHDEEQLLIDIQNIANDKISKKSNH